ncbi:MAG: leucyl aminopeptidase [Calditrichaeota bacterium]|nr:leucyl aminopeptidase [Calditrichota bacterium]
MEWSVIQKNFDELQGDSLIFPLFEGENADRTGIPDFLKSFISARLIQTKDFEGKENTVLTFPIPREEWKLRRITLVGLGKKEDFGEEMLRRAMGTAAAEMKKRKMKTVLISFRHFKEEGFSDEKTARIIVEGFGLGSYEFNLYKKKEAAEKGVETVSLWTLDASVPELDSGIRLGRHLVDATAFSRDLANHPSNVATPAMLANTAKEMGQELGLSVDVLGKNALRKLGMGALLAVSKGSAEEPALIILEHGTPRKTAPTVVLIGKGITFDSGGISLKSSKNMDEMKYDMAGGAAVFGILKAVALLKLRLHVIGIIPAAENLPGASAYKPGDIVTSLSGQTIEILNTDAEGRLVLADAITFSAKYKPDILIDLATLTGAAVVALGHAGAAVMGNAPDVIDDLQKLSEETGEKVWPIPLWKAYHDQLKSDIADMKNIGGGPGGLPVAGAFLENFVENTKWAHLDIAGVAWTTQDLPYSPKGATGFGVRLMVAYLRKLINAEG